MRLLGLSKQFLAALCGPMLSPTHGGGLSPTLLASYILLSLCPYDIARLRDVMMRRVSERQKMMHYIEGDGRSEGDRGTGASKCLSRNTLTRPYGMGTVWGHIGPRSEGDLRFWLKNKDEAFGGTCCDVMDAGSHIAELPETPSAASEVPPDGSPSGEAERREARAPLAEPAVSSVEPTPAALRLGYSDEEIPF